MTRLFKTVAGLLALAGPALMTAPARALLNPPTPITTDTRTAGPDCNSPIAPLRADNGFMLRAANSNLQRKVWQPRGADMPFTVHVANGFDTSAVVQVCMRWHVSKGPAQKFTEASARIDSISAARDPTIVATIPDNLPLAPARSAWTAQLFGGDANVIGSYVGLGLVPLADVRIMVIKGGTIQADIIGALGVTSRWWAILLALVSTVAVLFVVARFCKAQDTPADNKFGALLRIISTRKGYASLSQFQIVLWTFVVGASAIYVMALSGELITITTGSLVLLGISATATIGSQIHSNREEARNAAAPAAAPADGQPSPPLPADAGTKNGHDDGPPRKPRLCDLITDRGEIDVARLQMLYFTLVIAAFVLMTVVAQSEIPEIPTNFLALMGISNGVYMVAKFNK